MLRPRRLLVLLPTVLVALMIIVILVKGRRYTVEGGFISVQDSPLSNLPGLAAQFGG